jgi:hypothetical protein
MVKCRTLVAVDVFELRCARKLPVTGAMHGLHERGETAALGCRAWGPVEQLRCTTTSPQVHCPIRREDRTPRSWRDAT